MSAGTVFGLLLWEGIKQMKETGLNQAQREIALSERTYKGDAVNVISVKLVLMEFTALQVKEAAEMVFKNADIAAAVLDTRGREEKFALCGRAASHCSLLPEMEQEEACRYVQKKDCVPLGYPEELYDAAVIPLREGGAMLYARFHHIIIDGYGMCLFAQKVLDILAGKEAGISVFFDDKMEECRETADTARAAGMIKDSEAFWRDMFSDAEFEPAVFADAAESVEKISVPYKPESGLKERVEHFARENSVTVPYVLAAAYAVYLAEATGKKDAVFLMPRLNRKEAEMKTLGCYTLLVPVRVRVGQADSFAEVCRKVQKAARLSSEYKEYGFGNILRVLRGENLAAGSLSEYVFNYYRYEIQTELEYSLELSVAGAMHNHFTWNIFQADGEMSFVFDLRKGVYDAQRAEYFAESIVRILNCGIGGKPVCDIPVLGDMEQGHLFSVRGKEVEIDENATIPSLFQNAVYRYGARPALYAGEESYTFDGLDKASDAIACGLMEKGVQNGDSVAFMLKRDIRLIPTMLGIAKTGAAFIPVDPMYPKDRVSYIIEDSQAKFLISSADVAAAEEYEYLAVEELLSHTGEELKLPKIRQGQTAYSIYTSGTTGKPKGVLLTHRGIVNIVHPDNNPFNRDIVSNGTGIVAIGSICFDISLFEIFVPLLNGLFVELGNEKAMVDAGELAKHILRHGADILHCTPSRMVSYLRNPDFALALKGIKSVLSAGEVLPESLVHELKNNYGIRIYNGYGPTETTIGATITESGDSRTIGVPIANTGLLLLNKSGKQVPYGASGEICIYGAGVGIGYKGRKEETEKKFTDYAGRRLYHTGDIGRFCWDGKLLYYGRCDRQVKLRGLRIELTEIENVMGTYENVSQAVCIVKKIERTEHLAAFFTTEKGCTVDTGLLKEYLKEKLPSYMVPDILKELDQMPQTPGGKTDIKELGELPVDFTREYRAPENDMERAVCKAFSNVLGIGQVGLDDNFFELGGDSLSAVELMVDIEQEIKFGEAAEIDYGDVFRYPTPAKLAAKISEDGGRRSYPIGSLDYTGIDAYLAKNSSREEAGRELGNVLITGASGYLGVHILVDLLKNPKACQKIFCLVRPGGRRTAVQRMKSTLFYYAEEDFSESYGKKWFVVEGDITEPQIFEEDFTEHIDTVINSAANVSHFVYGNSLERVNVGGVKNLIAYALQEGALLCQVSTISVGGACGAAHEPMEFTENCLYIGQEIFNQYIYSKYMAEYVLLKAAVEKGLAVKIMRVGNLQGRSSDGEFQMNMRTNAFTRQLSAYIKMCTVPESIYHASVNFSPVDETAHMITVLAKTDLCHTVFHVYPPKEVEFFRLFASLGKMGHKVRVVPDGEFEELLQSMKQSEEGRAVTEGLLTERSGEGYREIPVTQETTNALLALAGEAWLPVTEEYLNRYLNALEGMDMF